MQFKINSEKGKMTVKIAGDIDHHSADPLREGVETAIKKDRPALLVLDMSGVDFMDSSGFGFVMGRYKTMDLSGGAVSVIGCKDRILKMLRLSGADKFVSIEGRTK